MRTKLFKMLPLMAAVLLATSCSKDDDGKEAVEIQSTTIPFSITVNSKSAVSKISATDNGATVSPIFTADDKLKITTLDGKVLAEALSIREGSISEDGKSATFEGLLDTKDVTLTSGVTDLTGEVGNLSLSYPEAKTNITEAIQYGSHQKGNFTYKSDGSSIILMSEQNSYIEVNCDYKKGEKVPFYFKSDSYPSFVVELQLDDNGKGCIVVPGSMTVDCYELDVYDKSTKVGKISTIKRIGVTEIILDKTEMELNIDDEETLSVMSILPDNASNKNYNWHSDNEEVATVDENGKVRAVGGGSTIIAAVPEDGSDARGVCSVTVNILLITNIYPMGEYEMTIGPGSTHALEVRIDPENATNKQLSWESSNPDVVVVDDNGMITASSQGGEATITATTTDGSNLSITWYITVEEENL